MALFPGMFTGVLQESILKRAIDRGLLRCNSTMCATMRTTSTARWYD